MRNLIEILRIRVVVIYTYPHTRKNMQIEIQIARIYLNLTQNVSEGDKTNLVNVDNGSI